ncbi:MAG TPA: ParA family protein [Mycobacteriales bacterium]|nr:ParA family protein [Mycobacteriales bacterium]
MKVLAVYSVKGGVGKTTAAVNLAWLSAAGGHRTVLCDLDPQGAASYLVGAKPRMKGGASAFVHRERPIEQALKLTAHELLDVLPADFSFRNLDLELSSFNKPTRRLRKVLTPLEETYDFAVLDAPAGIGLLSETVLAAADVVALPLVPSTLSVRTLEQLTTFMGEMEKPPRVCAFFSMVDRRRAAHKELIERLPHERDDVLPVEIPYAAVVEQMADRQAPVVAYAPKSPAAQAYEQLWLKLRVELARDPEPSRSGGDEREGE